MTFHFLKKAALPGLALFCACASPLASLPTAPAEHRQAERIATLISEELPAVDARSKNSDDSFDPSELSRHIVRLSQEYDIDPLLVLAIIKVESGFKPRARSCVGAIGLMQVMPIVLREAGSDVKVLSRDELYDPYKNVLLGIHYFTSLKDKYGNNLQNALAAYNLGPSTLDLLLTHQDFIPTSYARKVLRCYQVFQEKMRAKVAFLSVT
jgi:soluble lytic murein transglycosylase-like protein